MLPQMTVVFWLIIALGGICAALLGALLLPLASAKLRWAFGRDDPTRAELRCGGQWLALRVSATASERQMELHMVTLAWRQRWEGEWSLLGDRSETAAEPREHDPLLLAAHLPWLARRVLALFCGSLRFHAEIELHFGFDDPASTGVAAGLLASLAGSFPSLSVAIFPEFWQPDTRGHGEFTVRFRPLVVLLRLIRVALTRRGRAALRAVCGERSGHLETASHQR